MAIEHQDSQADGGANSFNNLNAVDIVKVDGNVFALLGGDDDDLQVFSIDNDPASPTYGQLSDSPVTTVSDSGSTFFSKVFSIHHVEIGGSTYVYAGGDEKGISVYQIDASGNLTSVQNVADNGSTLLDKVNSLSSVSVDDGVGGTNTFLFTGSEGEEGISAFQVASDGTLTSVDSVADDATVNLKKVYGLDTVQVDDGVGGVNTFVIAGGKDDDGLSVFEVASDGTLTNVDNVADTGSTHLSKVRAVVTHEIDGAQYVFAGGEGGGISAFEVASDGTLTHRGSIADDGTLNLDKINDLVVQDHQGTPTIWAGGDDKGLDAFEITVDGGTGAVSFSRVANFDEGTYNTGNIRALGGGDGYVGAGNHGPKTAEAFTAPCFAPGTLILTPDGERPVEDLTIGDMVVTADRGLRPIRWIGRREVVFDAANPRGDKDKPVLIQRGALGRGMPRRDLIVSPQHRMVLFGSDIFRRYGAPEVFAIAKALTGLPGIRRMHGKRRVIYFALLLDRHEVLFAEGAATESFRPGPVALAGFAPEHRRQIFAIYPGLVDDPDGALGPPARPLTRHAEIEELVRRRKCKMHGAGAAGAPPGVAAR